MQPNVYNDLTANGCKTVFIITTAGDAGKGEKYWLAREEGCISSIRYCLAASQDLRECEGTRELENRGIFYKSVNHATAYFLRLPDGNLDGSGFAENDFQSLQKFWGGEIESIKPLDNSPAYQSHEELINTIASIIRFEKDGTSEIFLHYQNPDTTQNPRDHCDHVATGIVMESMKAFNNAHQFLYNGYSVAAGKSQLSPDELFWKIGMFAAYEKTVFDTCGYSTLRETQQLI